MRSKNKNKKTDDTLLMRAHSARAEQYESRRNEIGEEEKVHAENAR